MRLMRCAAVVVLVAAAVTGPIAPALGSTGCAAPKGIYRQATPWAQRMLDPERTWPLSDGTGQTVAIIGTGIDARNGQFGRGQVLPGADLLRPAAAHAPADSDCDGRGTFAAGIVGAHPDPATTFAGLAPGVRLLPIRYTQSTGGSAQDGDPGRLAAAIRVATSAHAGVILVVVPAVADSRDLRGAVADARRSGAVVVSPAVAGDAGARSYPTADPGVVGVGAVDEHGAAVQAESGAGIVLCAPGADLVSTSAGAGGRLGHAWGVKDAQFAAAFVAGAAALVRAYRPGLSADQIVTRLTLTADRPATSGRDPRLGWGVVDPYAALTAMLPPGVAGPGAATRPPAHVASPRLPHPCPGPSPIAGPASSPSWDSPLPRPRPSLPPRPGVGARAGGVPAGRSAWRSQPSTRRG